MKLGATTMTEPFNHKMNITDMDHRSTGFYTSFREHGDAGGNQEDQLE